MGNKSSEFRYTLKDMPESMRPRERLLREGADHLSEGELLAIILGTGSNEDTVLELAQKVLTHMGGLRELTEASKEELERIPGIGPAKVCQIKGALELGRRLYTEEQSRRYSSARGGIRKTVINSPEAAAEHLMATLRYLDREQLMALMLDIRNNLIGNATTISVGTVNSSLAHPRECFKEAIRRSASSVIFVHNHPSGDPTPSAEDLALTRQLTEAGKVIGIDVLDHVIIGDGTFCSMKERGYLA
ncbi:MAG: hypothetical protein AUJ92_11780 [Armatimonadetes bacterium CG2_30_59_28]|nr:MAG: hypothetical protein AUJ92_11780 [Armatimonadetes bacterium CG2_30_59_28]PIU60808.1 MAG: hypothetical protein COS85_22600 [Armatimonadetes bacterium CG07_land_8_20_14_0_80_59_28]PIX44589.1 MAG: hypothetical protein COZ56_04155 [Armatimonadetes bacterium CG_4_8_14_3_um_filter_58_9]PIY44243.1 MAG: hypothetical protein COZ05_08730 [Armatimonadetes bacterium CG_4_10_14_3_um_filter_59_10]